MTSKRKTKAKRTRKQVKLIVRRMRDNGQKVNRKIINDLRLDMK